MVVLAGLLCASAYLAWRSSADAAGAAKWEDHTQQVLVQTAQLRLATLATVRGERGYLLTHDESFLAPYATGRAQMGQTMELLDRSVADNPVQQARLDELRRRVEEHLATMEQIVALERNGEHDAALQRIRRGEGRAWIESIMAQVNAFEAAEQELLAQRQLIAQATRAREEKFEFLLGAIGLLLLLLGILATVALRRSQTREAEAVAELRRIAVTDELTGLANRREAFAAIDRLIAAARRHARPLTIAILDIDRFKLVNDTHGHPAGDEVIRAVGDAATRIMREQDLVGRLGGEEFIIAFPDCAALDAVAACERLRAAVADTPIMLGCGLALGVTVSFGVACFVAGEDRTGLIAPRRRSTLSSEERRARPGPDRSLKLCRRVEIDRAFVAEGLEAEISVIAALPAGIDPAEWERIFQIMRKHSVHRRPA